MMGYSVFYLYIYRINWTGLILCIGHILSVNTTFQFKFVMINEGSSIMSAKILPFSESIPSNYLAIMFFFVFVNKLQITIMRQYYFAKLY